METWTPSMTSSRKQLPSLTEVRAERCRRRLRDFVRFGWETVEPGTPLAWNWHIDAICEHLEAVTKGDITRLVINIPPGHMKSLIVAVFWPAWEWIAKPETRSLFGSYAQDLAIRDSVKCRDLLCSEFYQEHFEPDWILKSDQNEKGYFVNSRRGFRYSLSVGGQGTGWRGHKVVVDDPLNAKESHSVKKLEEAIFWWDKVMSSRLNDMRTGKRVVIMQRLHEKDLTGHLLEKGGYEHLCLPSEFEPDRKASTSIGWEDPRKVFGELLFPEMFPLSVLTEVKKDLGSDGFAGQHQQRPAPAEGNIFKQRWWRFWQYPGQRLEPVRVMLADGGYHECPVSDLPADLDALLQSWDMAFKDTAASDFVAGQVWGRKGAMRFLLDQALDRIDFAKTCTEVRTMSDNWPKATTKLIEDKANGPAVISSLGSEVSGLIAVNPEGGKEGRAWAVQPLVEAGNVYLPHPSIAPWIWHFITECATFPNAAHDDQVDAMTQALIRWMQNGPAESAASIY